VCSGFFHSDRNPQSEIESPAAFAGEDDVDGLKENAKIKEEEQV
jgi:hypothetical protein